MKVKRSIRLSAHAAFLKSRSDFIEAAVRAFLARKARGQREARDLTIINGKVDRLNAEATEVLEYQKIP